MAFLPFKSFMNTFSEGFIKIFNNASLTVVDVLSILNFL